MKNESTKVKVSLNQFLILAIAILTTIYLLQLFLAGGFSTITMFKSLLWIQPKSQETRKKATFSTKYILPVSYSFFPYVDNHPNFIRYYLPVMVYALLFKVFSPNAAVINILNGVLFVINGALVFLIVQKLLRTQKEALNISSKEIDIIALLTTISSSFLTFTYLRLSLLDNYEVLSYTLILLMVFLALDRQIKPIILGAVGGLLFLSKPSFAFFIFTITFYFLLPDIKNFKRFFLRGLVAVLGFFIIVSPFIIRSIILTGEPLFALQNKVDIIKGIVYSHDQLYKSFSIPPAAKKVISNNIDLFFQRWGIRFVSAIKNLFSIETIAAWIGIPLLIIKVKERRDFILSYLFFLIIHMIVVANYLEVTDTVRIYTSILPFLIVLGYTGIFVYFYLFFKDKLPVMTKRIIVSLGICAILPSLSSLHKNMHFRKSERE